MNTKKLLMIGLCTVALAACGKEETQEGHEGHENHATTSDEKVQRLTVDLTVPEHIKKGKAVEIKALVKHGKEKVNDADEVMFEVIKDGDTKNSVKENVKEAKDGVYTFTYTFKEDGKYNIISHVTAFNYHTMPNKEITIGEASHEDSHNEHHHAGMIHIMDIKAEKDKETTLMMHVMDEHGKPLSDASVTRYEVKTPSGKTEWIDLKESKSGEYETKHTFSETGKYTVTAHAEKKPDFHVHEETSFEIK
ncbi:FixH family protein [Macrococcus armenti]|uniref:FixH family protein n=1 Tax=Macrococcus armenti TaxID=2875764 RepID=A0ABY3ZW49_9STAP|nr:FixH family protein [Macrococcus armenti]UOB21027.1 FixH family protein [Macrococcus armenti]